MAFQGEIGRATVAVETDISGAARGIAELKRLLAAQMALFGRATDATKTFTKTIDLSGFAVGALTGALGTLVAAFSIREVLSWINAFQNVENGMRAAGVASDDLADSTKQLFDVAVATRAPIEEMGQLYQQLTIQTKELGLSQKEIFSLMKLVGQGIAVSGTSAEAARGALLQFGQMLGTSRVRMQEFNSVQMGAPALLRAAAAGIDKAGGSVARLRELVSAGKISNQDFYQGLIKGSATITDAFGKMVPTLAQAGTVFRDALIEVTGRADEAAGGTRALAQAVIDLSEAMKSQGFQDFLKDAIESTREFLATGVMEFNKLVQIGRALDNPDAVQGFKDLMAALKVPDDTITQMKRLQNTIDILGERRQRLASIGPLFGDQEVTKRQIASIDAQIVELKAKMIGLGASAFKGPQWLERNIPDLRQTPPTAVGQLPASPADAKQRAVSAEDARAMEAVEKQTIALGNKLRLAKLPAGELRDALTALGADVDLSKVIDEAGNLIGVFKTKIPILEQAQQALKDVQTPEALAASLDAVRTELTKLRTEYENATGAAREMLALKIGDLEAQQLQLVNGQAKALAQQYRDVFKAKKEAAFAAITPAAFTVTFDDTDVGRAEKTVSDLKTDIAKMQQAGAFDVEVRLKTEALQTAQDELKRALDSLQARNAHALALRMNTTELETAKQELTDLEAKLVDLQEAGIDSGDIRMRVIVEGIDAATVKFKALTAERDRLLKAQPTTNPAIEAALKKVADIGEELSRLKASGGLDAEITAKTVELDAATKKLQDMRRAGGLEPIEVPIVISADEAQRQADQVRAALSQVFEKFENQSGITFGEFRKQFEAVAATAPPAVKKILDDIIVSLSGISSTSVVALADIKKVLDTGLSSTQVERLDAALAAANDQLKVAKTGAGAAGDAIRETDVAAKLLSETLRRPITIAMFEGLEKAGDAGAKKAREVAHIQAQAAAAAAGAGAGASRTGGTSDLDDLKRKVEAARDELKLFDATVVAEGESMTEAQRQAKALAEALSDAGKTQAEFAAMSPNNALRRQILLLAEAKLELLDHAEANRIAAAAAEHAAAMMEHEGSAAQLAQRKLNDARPDKTAPPPSPPLPVAKPLGEAATADLDQQNALMKQQLPLLQVQADLGDAQAKRDIERINRLMEINRLVALGQQGQPGGITEAQAVPLRREVQQQGSEQGAQAQVDQARIDSMSALPDKIDAANIAAQELSSTLTDVDNLSFKSLEQSCANIAQSISQMIVQALIFRAIMGAAMGTPAPAAGGGGNPAGLAFGAFPFKATGGPVQHGETFIGSEKGKELWVGHSGKVRLIEGPGGGAGVFKAPEAGNVISHVQLMQMRRLEGGTTQMAPGKLSGGTLPGGGDTLNFDFRGMSPGAVADAMNRVYAAARRDVFKELSRSPTSRRSIGLRGGVR